MRWDWEVMEGYGEEKGGERRRKEEKGGERMGTKMEEEEEMEEEGRRKILKVLRTHVTIQPQLMRSKTNNHLEDHTRFNSFEEEKKYSRR